MIGVALLLAVATYGGSLHWIGTYGGTALRKSRAVGNTTRNGDVANDRGHIDPVRNGDAFEITGYGDYGDRREGQDKVP